jgi:sigma-B regulation protein RsbU (phosphoserine phosphatase)
MKLLLVEDDTTTRLLLENLLQRQGYQVDSFVSGEEAVNACKKAPYDLAVLDWMLPGMDGIELCKWLRSQPWGDGIYLMMLTSREEPADLQRALEAGANDFLSKPVEPEMLELRLQIAQRLLTIRQQLSEVAEQG